MALMLGALTIHGHPARTRRDDAANPKLFWRPGSPACGSSNLMLVVLNLPLVGLFFFPFRVTILKVPIGSCSTQSCRFSAIGI